jgi:hypothetical protein
MTPSTCSTIAPDGETPKPERKAPCGTITGMAALDTTWQTPPELLEPVRAYFGGQIPFDPATAEGNPTGAEVHLVAGGLEADWSEHRGVYVNPPYGRVLREWLAKIEHEARGGSQIITLLPAARWEQAYFQSMCVEAEAMCLIRKRVSFIRPSTGDRVSGNPYANLFLGFNVDLLAFLTSFKSVGACFELKGLSGPPQDVRRPPSAPRPKKARPA